jgi:hypothetical protein
MSRIDPQFAPDFRPGYRPDYSAFEVLDQDPHPDDYPAADDLEVIRKKLVSGSDALLLMAEKTRAARGIVNGVCISLVFWAFVAAIILLVWGI